MRFDLVGKPREFVRDFEQKKNLIGFCMLERSFRQQLGDKLKGGELGDGDARRGLLQGSRGGDKGSIGTVTAVDIQRRRLI